MLVAAGANLTIQDNDGRTPKVLALLADDHSLAAYLESKWIDRDVSFMGIIAIGVEWRDKLILDKKSILDSRIDLLCYRSDYLFRLLTQF